MSLTLNITTLQKKYKITEAAQSSGKSRDMALCVMGVWIIHSSAFLL